MRARASYFFYFRACSLELDSFLPQTASSLDDAAKIPCRSVTLTTIERRALGVKAQSPGRWGYCDQTSDPGPGGAVPPDAVSPGGDLAHAVTGSGFADRRVERGTQLGQAGVWLSQPGLGQRA